MGQWRSRRVVRAAGSGERPIAMIDAPTDAVESVFREFQRLDANQREQLWQRIRCSKTGNPDLTVDEVILNVLAGGHPVTVNDVTTRFRDRVRMRLEKLRARWVVVREGRGGSHCEFTYRLVRPDRAGKAIGEKGGGLARLKREKNGNGSLDREF
jgi:hypothetical protein